MERPSSRRFGPFFLERELGRGTGGVVFLAVRDGGTERYALKVNTSHADRETLIRLQLEAEVTTRLDHPGVVRALEQGVVEGRHYLLMEYCEGESLAARLTRGPLGWREATVLVRDLARIMEVAHRQGILHRDLKPANVMLESGSGRPRIIDFGLARDASLVRSLTRSSVMMGTPITMAPEQFTGGEVGPSTDVYALGAIFYCCLTGRPPFQAADIAELGRQVCRVEAVSPRRQVPDLPPGVDRVCLDALAKRHDWRPADAGVLADRFDDALAEADGGGGATARRAPAPLIVALCTVVVGALGVGLWALLAGSDTGEPGAVAQEASAQDAVEHALARCLERARAGAPLSELLTIVEQAEALAGTDPLLRAKVRLERADFCRRRGDYQACIAAAPIDAPGYEGFAARFLVGLAHLRLGRRPDSEATFRALAADDPTGCSGLHAQAVLEIANGGPWGETMQRARDANPQDVQAQIGAAYGLSVAVSVEASLAAIAKLMEREPDEPHLYFERAFVYSGSGQPKLAIEAYGEVLKRTAPFASHQALLGRAGCWLDLGKFENTVADCERLLTIDPRSTRGHILRGIALSQLGRREDADRSLQLACERRDPRTWELELARLHPSVVRVLRTMLKELEQR